MFSWAIVRSAAGAFFGRAISSPKAFWVLIVVAFLGLGYLGYSNIASMREENVRLQIKVEQVIKEKNEAIEEANRELRRFQAVIDQKDRRNTELNDRIRFLEEFKSDFLDRQIPAEVLENITR